MTRSQQSKQMNQRYGNTTAQFFETSRNTEPLQYFYDVPFCKSGQKAKSGYILAGAGFVKVAGFLPEPKSGTALLLCFLC